MKNFDIIHTPLNGVSFIEASAGTGKTYNLEGLYIRLILEKELTPDQILVVTFTRAATEELKNRIRKKLVSLQEALSYQNCQDEFICRLSKDIENVHQAKEIVQTALVNFDRAAIYTIHGFCQRILNENAFETGTLFDAEVEAESSRLYQEIAEDYWRNHIHEAPHEVVIHGTLNRISGPEFFAAFLRKSQHPGLNIIPNPPRPSMKCIENYRSSYEEIKDLWGTFKSQVSNLLMDPCLSGNRYGSLKPVKAGEDLTKRHLRINELTAAMDEFTADNSTGFPLFKRFDYFRQDEIIRSTKKGGLPPQHVFFQACEKFSILHSIFQSELDRYLLFLKSDFLRYAQAELDKRRKNTHLLQFNDLLIMVKQALEGSGGKKLANRIRKRYHAVLVDEFQDTDAIQYAIFSRLFIYEDRPFFLIGDPKQAIYGFRGADVFSYLDAVKHADDLLTLSTNYRSDPPLISAVNAIFSNHTHPFLFNDIFFHELSPGIHGSTGTDGFSPAMILWHLFFDEDQPIPKERAIELTASAMVNEISRLCSTSPHQFQFKDVAVLVRTNRQAKLVQQHLSEKNIPSVIYQSGNIFHCHEALELQRLLLGIASQDNERRIRAAISTDLLGGNGDSSVFDDESFEWERCLVVFKGYLSIWKEQGFIRMFRRLMAEEGVKERLMAFPDGERRLTNIMHLCELLHQAVTTDNLDPTGLVKWLNEKRQSADYQEEANLLRMESDGHAVNILTIHKSKGLEFPVVFCPFAWDSSDLRDREVEFHDPEHQNCRTLDLGSEFFAKNKIRAQNELLAENLRLLYVALTRARNRCYFTWGRINNTETSALAYLLHHDGKADEDIVGPLKKTVESKTNKDLLTDVKRVAERSSNSLSIEQIPVMIEGGLNPELDIDIDFSFRQFSGRIARNFQISSFSGMTASKPLDINLPDRDSLKVHVSSDIYSPDNGLDAPGTPGDDIKNFPKGTRAGLFFHDIFEQIDFTEARRSHLESIVGEKLLKYGFDPRWNTAVTEMISNVLSTHLHSGLPGLTLSRITERIKVNELDFYFPVEQLSPKILSDIFQKHANSRIHQTYYKQIRKLTFFPVKGFIKGFVDMVFLYDNRYYLVDWKSNYLGPESRHYDNTAMAAAMVEHHYVLQYHLYVLALHRYLKMRSPSYRYEADFGGVFYLFIRGMTPDKDHGHGIYFDRPEIKMIQALETKLTR